MEFIYEVKTNKSFQEAITSLKESLSENEFGVLWEFNIKDKLTEKGLDFKTNFQILEVCNPQKAKQVLEENLKVGYFLPCKIVVYEEGGETFIGMPKPTQLMGIMGETKLEDVAGEVEKVLRDSMEKAAK